MRSDTANKGKTWAPHRSLFQCTPDLPRKEMNRPLVVSYVHINEIVPGHMNLDKITKCSKKTGVAMAEGGTPIMFPTIAVQTESQWDISE